MTATPAGRDAARAARAAALDEQASTVLSDLRDYARVMSLPYDVATADRVAAVRTLAGSLRGTSIAALRRAASRVGLKRITSASGVDLAERVARNVVDAEVDRSLQLRHLRMVMGADGDQLGASLARDARDIDLGVEGVADALVDAGLTYSLADAIAVLDKAAAIARRVEREGGQGGPRAAAG